MLILSRKVGEKIMIGDDIEITILKNYYKKDNIQIGINAPKGMSIHREEIYNKILKEKDQNAK